MATTDIFRRNPARDLEQFAVRVVESWVGKAGSVIDQSAGPEPDFRIEYRDGRVALGEVGWHEDRVIQEMWANTFRRDRHQVVPLPNGSGHWSLQLVRGAHVARLYRGLPDLITNMIAAGRSDLQVVGPWPRNNLGDRARQLGIEHLRKHADVPSEAVFFMPSTGGSMINNPNVIVDWANEVLASHEYADNTEKLLVRDANERHVFLMTGSATSFEVCESLKRIDVDLPTMSVAVPPGISHVWLVERYGSESVALWSRETGWTSVPIPKNPPHQLS